MTMDKLDKTIAGLACCGDYVDGCKTCPYHGEGLHMQNLMRDAHKFLTTLHDNRPRLLTLDEVRRLKPGTDVWRQRFFMHGEYDIEAATVKKAANTYLYVTGGQRWSLDGYSIYGKDWILWVNGRPTIEDLKSMEEEVK